MIVGNWGGGSFGAHPPIMSKVAVIRQAPTGAPLKCGLPGSSVDTAAIAFATAHHALVTSEHAVRRPTESDIELVIPSSKTSHTRAYVSAPDVRIVTGVVQARKMAIEARLKIAKRRQVETATLVPVSTLAAMERAFVGPVAASDDQFACRQPGHDPVWWCELATTAHVLNMYGRMALVEDVRYENKDHWIYDVSLWERVNE
jgi:hypothetical protein